MTILKFGGTSVSSKQHIDTIKAILNEKATDYIVVVSAFSGVTNQLEHIAQHALQNDVSELLNDFRERHFKMINSLFNPSQQTEVLLEVQQQCNALEALCNGVQLLKELSPRTQARIVSFGEQLSAFICHKYLVSQVIDLNLLHSDQLIVANTNHLNAQVDFATTNANIKAAVTKGGCYIASGFIASNHLGERVTLGRGGSDYSAAIYASAVDAEQLEIWSDIDGMHSANPQKVKHTKSINQLSYEEAFELAYFGAKVLYPPTVIPVMKKNIPVYLKNTFQPQDQGTLISKQQPEQNDKITGVSSLQNIAIITISGVGLAHQKGRARTIFETLEAHDINVILITQSCSEQSIGIGIHEDQIATAEQALNKAFERDIAKGSIYPANVVLGQCIIAVVGDNMKHKVGLSGKVFSALGENGINVRAIAQGASERNISIVIDGKDERKALNVIHEQFFSKAIKNVHLFVAGIGNVGSEFLKIVSSQRQKLIDEHHINLKVMGVANSKRFMLNHVDGISLDDVKAIQSKGTAYTSFSHFVSEVQALNLRNSVFIDNTASELVSTHYADFLQDSISVITCNKIASSSNFSNYKALNRMAKEYNAHFKYETSVGAALPIIKTIHDLNISGDHIFKIEAVISGSLNFIFNSYNANNQFADIVLQAMEEGYTEPNPLIDLSGLDVMRKILILTRESGYEAELDDISFNSFLPEDCSNAPNNEALFSAINANEAHFKDLLKSAEQKGCKLKVVAVMEHGQMQVALKEVLAESPFFHLEGKDNAVSIFTDRYPTEPIVIKGAGAGASVTASGVFADLIFSVNR